MKRLVLDTNVVVSGLLWSGPPRDILLMVREARIELFTSMPLVEELTEILQRRKFASRVEASGITGEQLATAYRQVATVVPVTMIPPACVDPDDDVVLGTALAGEVDLVVSGDVHLLSMKSYQQIPIVTSVQVLDIFRG